MMVSTSLGWACTALAKKVMPKNMVPSKPLITIMVEAAFFVLGSLKAGIPLLTASTPVMAEHPLLKAYRMRNQP